jgi:hypothetical protein
MSSPQLPILPYADRSGHVADSDTSTDRAIQEDNSGVTAARQRAILDYVESRGWEGAIWSEVAEALNLHHGQASGALSVLHKAGHLFVKRNTKRHNCAVYVGASYKPFVRPEERQDEPKQTSNTKQQLALDALLDAVDRMLYAQTMTTVQEVRVAYNTYREMTLWAST